MLVCSQVGNTFARRDANANRKVILQRIKGPILFLGFLSGAIEAIAGLEDVSKALS